MNDVAHAATPGGAAPPPRPWLLADIGGTHARFGWLAEGEPQPAHIASIRVADHDGPASAAQAYLAQLAQVLRPGQARPRAAAFAMATSVGDDEVAFTNSGWTFSRAATQRALQLDLLLALNDFEALALSLPRLGASQLRPIGMAGGTDAPLPRVGQATLAVVGPGTGLGVAGLVPTPLGWVALPGEGGHATLAPGDDFESALLAWARREHAHVSAERLLSGIGLPLLHAATAAVLDLPLPAGGLSAREIVEQGVGGGDALCSRTLDCFCALLGNFAGNVALTLGARGGVFIGGGIVPRLGERFFRSAFRQRFEAKGRFQAYLKTVPTALITDTQTALVGAALALEQHRP
jgi:glucokinase